MQSVTSNAVAEKIEDLIFDLKGHNSVTLDLSRYASSGASAYHSGVICGVLAGVGGFSLLYKSDGGTITKYGIDTPYLTINHNVDAKTVTFTNTAVNAISVKGFIRVHP